MATPEPAAPALQKVDFKNLKPREIAIMVVVALLILGFGWHKFEYEKLAKRSALTEKKLTEVEGLIASFKQAIVTPERIKQTEEDIVKVNKEMEAIRAEIKEIQGKMSAKSVNILQQLKKEAGGKGGILRSFKTSEQKVTKGKFTYRTIGIVMKIESEYGTITSLVKKFDNIPEFLSLKGMETERVEDILPLVESVLRFELVVF